MKKYSNNKKLNGVLNEIRKQLLSIHDTKAESLAEVEHYMDAFPREIDYNLVQYGNMLIYYSDVRKMYEKYGYKSMARMSDAVIWETYKRQVGWVVRNL